jgi:hypothetical protein
MACFIHLTDVVSGNLVAINPTKVVCIFTNKDPDSGVETTVVNLVNGNVGVTEDYLETIGRLQGVLI